MVLLLYSSGIPLAEGKNLKRFYKTPESAANFEAYFARTSPVVPCPPCLWMALPDLVKRFCCFESPSYKYRPEADQNGNGAFIENVPDRDVEDAPHDSSGTEEKQQMKNAAA